MKNLDLIDLPSLTFTVFDISDGKKERKKDSYDRPALQIITDLRKMIELLLTDKLYLTQNAFV